jgi:hypothetical protein
VAVCSDEASAGCAAFLAGSVKARLQMSLESDLAAFDQEAAGLKVVAGR